MGDYFLKSRKVVIISPSSKARAQQNGKSSKSPPPKILKKPVPHSRARLRDEGLIPLGNKGKISVLYNERLKVKYISQLFRKHRELGKGSYGMVNAYMSVEDGQCYAIKTISKRSQVNEVINMDIIDGAPNCIEYYNAWQEEKVAYIQMELGEISLSEYAEKNHHITEEECWHIMHDVCIALKHIHDLKYCHMDVKPSNIIIKDGHYKLADFGLLTNYEIGIGDNHFGSDGDGKYISAEALQGNIGPPGDIFALGLTILELATDINLPDFGSGWQSFREECTISIPRTRDFAISDELLNTINWMISKNPKSRPTACQLLQTQRVKEISRARKHRVNYFKLWQESQHNPEDEDNAPLVITINQNNSLPLPSSREDEKNISSTPPSGFSYILLTHESLLED